MSYEWFRWLWDKTMSQTKSQDFGGFLPIKSERKVRQLDNTSLKCNIEGKATSFKNSFFYRTHTIWNDLTVPLREIIDSNAFQDKLKEFMWEKMIDPH